MNHEKGSAAVVIHAKKIEFKAAAIADDVEGARGDFLLKFVEQLGDMW